MIRRAAAVLAVAAAAGPLLAAAVVEAVHHPVYYFDGDFALDEMALMRSARLLQLVGNYSRFGWSHPGPAWFYALDIVYLPSGRASWAFVAGMLVLNALAAALVVTVAWRAGGPGLAVVAATLLVLYQGALGDILFRDPWPPYAVVLPMALLLTLAAAGAAGSSPALAGSLLTGSYLVQTHLGTAPTVLVVVTVAIALRAALTLMARRDATLKATRPMGTDLVVLAGGMALALLMWVPPLIDEQTQRPGNLTLLWQFFATSHSTHRYLASLSVLGRFLSVVQLGTLGTLNSLDLATVSGANLAYAAAAALAFAGLAFAGKVAHDRFGFAMGVILCVALPVITVSIHLIVGPVYAYLLLWVSTLPLAAAMGWASVLLKLAPPTVVRGAPRIAWAMAALLLVVLAGLRLDGLLALPPPHASAADTVQAWRLTRDALSGYPPQPVVMELQEPDAWILAAGVSLQLVKSGYAVRVRPDLLFEYGNQSRTTGTEKLAMVVVDRADADSYRAANLDAQAIGETQDHSLYLKPLAV